MFDSLWADQAMHGLNSDGTGEMEAMPLLDGTSTTIGVDMGPIGLDTSSLMLEDF